MSDEFVNISGSGTSDPNDRPIRARRRSVRLFLLGEPEDVEETIAAKIVLVSNCSDDDRVFRLNLSR